MSTENLVILIVLALAALLAGVGFRIYNRLVRSMERTREAWSGIDVQLKRRASLIPNLVETVKGYAAHERTVFEEVTRARAAVQNAGGAAAAAEANDMLTRALGRLFAVAENYPALRATENFKDLQDDLADVEEKIAYARQFYNSNAADFNTRIQSVPAVFIAKMMSYERFEYFETEEESRQDVTVRFSPPNEPASPESPPSSSP